MPGLCRLNGDFHRLSVSDLAQKNDMRRLSKCIFEPLVVGSHVLSDLLLGDESRGGNQLGLAITFREKSRVAIFDRIFNRYDMPRMSDTEPVEKGGQGSGLPRTGLPRDKPETLSLHHNGLERPEGIRGDPESFKIGNFIAE